MAITTDAAAADREYCKEHIGARLAAKGWKQADLCRATGISKQSMSQYMAALAMPGKAALRKIAKAFDCQPTDFIRPFDASHASLPMNGDQYCEVRECTIPNYKIFMCRVSLPATLALAMAQQVVEHLEKHPMPTPAVAETVAAAAGDKKQKQGRAKRAGAKA